MYDKDKLLNAIWNNPRAVAPLNWELTHGGSMWQAAQYPDGSDGHGRRDRTTLKRGTGTNGATIWVHCNGDFGTFQQGNIWGYLHWLWNTNEHIDVLQRVGEAYGIEPDMTEYTPEQIARAKQRRDEKAILRDVANYITSALVKTDYGRVAREYAANRGLQPSPRLGAWNSSIKAELLKTLPAKYGTTADTIDALLKRLFPTWTQGAGDKWRDAIDDYQLAIPYTNGSGNYVGFVLRKTADAADALPKYKFSKDMPKGGYCETLQGGDEPVLLVEGILDAEAMKQHGFANVVALGGQTPTDNGEDAAKSTIQTLLRYNTTKLIYIPDYEYKSVKDGSGNIIGVEDYPTPDATLRTIKALLPHMAGVQGGSGFISLRIADLETTDAKRDKAKVDADTFLRKYTPADMRRVLEEAAPWYEYELKIAAQRAKDADTLATWATAIYCSIGNIAQRNRLKDAITSARSGYLAQLKEAGINAAALSLIDKNGQHSTWAESMAAVVEDMRKERTPDGMAALLTKAERIQHADTYNAFAAQVNITREDMHKLVAAKPDYLQTPWALYKEVYNPATHETKTTPNRNISFAPAAVSIIAAPTNHGKTLILLQTAIKLAQKTGKRFIYLSLENDAEQLYIRAITAYMGKAWKPDAGNLRGEVRKWIKSDDMPTTLFAADGKELNIDKYIRQYWAEVAPRLALVRTDADIDAIVNNVEAQVEAWRNNGEEVGGIFVDYLQLLHYPAMRAHSRTDEVKGICDRLNDMAKATKLPVILAAQFNRDATKANGDKLDGVELANIGESAGIENIAEDVYLVWQTDKINPDGKEYSAGTGDAARFHLQPYQTRSRRCFKDLADKNTLRRGYLYVENLKARDYATGGYCLLRFNGAAGAIISDESEK